MTDLCLICLKPIPAEATTCSPECAKELKLYRLRIHKEKTNKMVKYWRKIDEDERV